MKQIQLGILGVQLMDTNDMKEINGGSNFFKKAMGGGSLLGALAEMKDDFVRTGKTLLNFFSF